MAPSLPLFAPPVPPPPYSITCLADIKRTYYEYEFIDHLRGALRTAAADEEEINTRTTPLPSYLLHLGILFLVVVVVGCSPHNLQTS